MYAKQFFLLLELIDKYEPKKFKFSLPAAILNELPAEEQERILTKLLKEDY